MPQLNFAWWIFYFLLSWLSLLIIFTILLNTNPNNTSTNTSTKISTFSNITWIWN